MGGMSRRYARRLLVLLGVTVGLCPAALAAPVDAALHSGTYAVTVHDGGTDFQFTWTLRVSGGTITGTSDSPEYGFIDPLSGSVQGTGAKIVRSCGAAARARFKDCADQTYVLEAGADGVLSGTGTGFGVLPGTTITMRSASATISGVVKASKCGASSCRLSGLKGVTVTAQGAGGSETATTGASGAFKIGSLEPGSWTITPALTGSEFNPSSAPVTLADDDVAGVDFETCASSHNTVRKTQAATGPAGAFCRLFGVAGIAAGRSEPSLEHQPLKLAYQGVGWDPQGGAVTITLNGRVTRKWPQTASFKGRVYATEWPQRDSGSVAQSDRLGCSAVVGAEQGGVARTQKVSTGAVGVVVFADGDATLQTSDVVCGGELPVLLRTAGTVIATDGFSTFGSLYVYQRGGLRGQAARPGDGHVACIGLVPSSHGYVKIKFSADGTRFLTVSRATAC